MEAGDGDLLAGAEGEQHGRVAVREGKPAEHDAGRGEGLLVTVVSAAVVEGGVELVLQPQVPGEVVLDGVVEGDGAAEPRGAADGKGGASRGGEGEPAEAFTELERGTDDGAAASVGVLAGGQAGGDEGADDGVVMLLVAAVEAVLEAEGDVAEAVRDAGGGVSDEGRRAEAELGAGEGNDLQALAVAEVPGGVGGGGLADEVGAQALLDARVGGDEGSGPVRLIDERGGGSGVVALEPAVLGVRRRGRQREAEEGRKRANQREASGGASYRRRSSRAVESSVFSSRYLTMMGV